MLALWEIAYIAGFFDGEGCIYAHPSSTYIQVEIGQVDRRPLDFIQQRYGGNVRCRNNFYKWLCPAKSLVGFLTDIQPCLIVKKEQAFLALQFRELALRSNNRYHVSSETNVERMQQRKCIAKAITEAKRVS